MKNWHSWTSDFNLLNQRNRSPSQCQMRFITRKIWFQHRHYKVQKELYVVQTCLYSVRWNRTVVVDFIHPRYVPTCVSRWVGQKVGGCGGVSSNLRLHICVETVRLLVYFLTIFTVQIVTNNFWFSSVICCSTLNWIHWILIHAGGSALISTDRLLSFTLTQNSS